MTDGILSGAAKRTVVRKMVQLHPDYAARRDSLGFVNSDGVACLIANATVASLDRAYESLYSYPFANGAHDDPAVLAKLLSGGDESIKAGEGRGLGGNRGEGARKDSAGDASGDEYEHGHTSEAESKPGKGGKGAKGKDSGEGEGEGDDSGEGEGKGKGAKGKDGEGEGGDEDEKAAKEARDAAKAKLSPMERNLVELIEKFAPAAKPRTATSSQTITIRPPHMPAKAIGTQHYRFNLALAAVAAGVNLMLVGPAGSGKTTAAQNIADAMGRRFGFNGAIASEYKLTGFVDAQGRVISTMFRDLYANGGVYLFDEIDGSLPSAILAFNAALSGNHADFPGTDGTSCMVKRHADAAFIGAANTFGRGADRQYVGRNQLDAATLDRFAVLTWDYDIGLEASMLGLPTPKGAPKPVKLTPVAESDVATVAAYWHAKVIELRRKAENSGVRMVVSPRASLNGLKLLVAGWPEDEVTEAVIWRGQSKDDRARVNSATV